MDLIIGLKGLSPQIQKDKEKARKHYVRVMIQDTSDPDSKADQASFQTVAQLSIVV